MSEIEKQSGKLLSKGRLGFEAGAEYIRAQVKTMPGQPGIYRFINAEGTILYIGKAKNLPKRVSSYTQRARLPLRLQRMVAQVRSLEIVITHTEAEALLLEANFIQRFLPPFNILLRDDKSYPYICITRDHDFPQLVKHRGNKTRKGWYFGPFASAGAVNETLTLLQRGFMLRNCSDSFFAARTRPCLQYHIKRCTAPCTAKVTKEEYDRQVQDAIDFLKGRTSEIQQKLAEEMQIFSDTLDYENAAKIRDRIKVLTSIQSRQGINVRDVDDADVIALHQDAGRTAVQIFLFRSGRNYGARTLYPSHDKSVTPGEIMESIIGQYYAGKPVPPVLLMSHTPNEAKLLMEALSTNAGHKVSIVVPKLGDKKRLIDFAQNNAKEALARKLAESSEQAKLLNRVAEIFDMAEAPKRIEVYDNSHISGSHAAGAFIAAGPEGFLKKTYRKFTIREADASDDYGMMKEVLTRRFRRLIEEDPEHKSDMWPDLVLIDGGQGQLNSVMAVMEELGLSDISVAGIAKGPDRNAGRERFFMPGREAFSLPPEDPALYYLQRLRDEAHRFVIGTHRAKRVKAISQTGLEDVPGIGSARKKALLHHFGSARAVSEAGIDDLKRVPGISGDAAKRIYDWYRG